MENEPKMYQEIQTGMYETKQVPWEGGGIWKVRGNIAFRMDNPAPLCSGITYRLPASETPFIVDYRTKPT